MSWVDKCPLAVKCLRDDLDLLACFQFPYPDFRKATRTTNAIERRFRGYEGGHVLWQCSWNENIYQGGIPGLLAETKELMIPNHVASLTSLVEFCKFSACIAIVWRRLMHAGATPCCRLVSLLSTAAARMRNVTHDGRELRTALRSCSDSRRHGPTERAMSSPK